MGLPCETEQHNNCGQTTFLYRPLPKRGSKQISDKTAGDMMEHGLWISHYAAVGMASYNYCVDTVETS